MSANAPIGDATAMLKRLETEQGVVLSASIEISDHCNETCAHCYQIQGQKGELSSAEVYGVLDELAAMGVLLLTISGGEATLRKDFIDIVAHARTKGFAIRLFTNGTTMTRELAQQLGRLAVQNVEISVYSTRAETHDFVTGVPGSFERTVAGVRHLVDASVPVTIKTPVMSVNQRELVEYERFAAELGVVPSFDIGDLMPREGGDRSPQAFRASDRARVGLMRTQAALVCGGADVSLNERPLSARPCTAGHGIHIEPNGELRPCAMLEFDLGHVLREGVGRAYAGHARRQELKALTWKSLHGCRECALRKVCAHCYAAALADAGDALGPYSGACRAARLSYEAFVGQAPRIVVADGHNPEVGPYREIQPHVFEAFDESLTAEDEQLARHLGWVRRARGPSPPADSVVHPGELVQIRRPGRKAPRLERVPGGPA